MFAEGREGRGTLKTLLLDVLIVFESMEVCTWKYTIIPQVLVLLPDGFMCVCVSVCVCLAPVREGQVLVRGGLVDVWGGRGSVVARLPSPKALCFLLVGPGPQGSL